MRALRRECCAAVQTGTAEDVEKYSKRTVRVTKQHNDECKRLLTLMGVPIIEVRLCGWTNYVQMSCK